jgi:rhamnosyltransferase
MFTVVVPTLNAAKDWPPFVSALHGCVRPEQVLIVDSESTDATLEMARAAGFQTCSVAREEFNHGGTRQMAAEMLPDAEILVYMTQDAVLAGPNALANLVAAFADPQVGAAYGRQLPRCQAGPIEAHARHFNYSTVSAIRSFESRKTLGFKAAFASNSFAAYRRTAFDQVGGFPSDAIVSEETIVFARLQMAGWKTAYVADAAVIHSHEHSLRAEFSRYFDIGVGYTRDSWIETEFGAPHGEGRRFVTSEIRYLVPRHIHLIPLAFLHSLAKVIGYQLGCQEAHLPMALKRALSNQKNFWSRATFSNDHKQPKLGVPAHPPGSD